MAEQILLHGNCLSVGEFGVLLLGPPGSGKSDLALRLVDQPGCGISGALKYAQLVADDQVAVKLEGGQLIASAPPAIAGRAEIRGLGIVNVSYRAQVVLAIAVQLTARQAIERLPEIEKTRYEILGTSLPMVLIDAASASAPARIRAALDWIPRV
ncbi:MAG: HPr kinase/phosphatase C-terminal domain-containing protein [Rhizobiales bacterium]|nr:HPr kinase/phosphatase C-terminal domain-containing protein [Hyphomicrobiales bacterium]